MENTLWFNQSGQTFNGISCDAIYGGCPQNQAGNFIVDNGVIPTGEPISAGLPAPGSTPEQIGNDVGYVLPTIGAVKPMRLVAGQRVGIYADLRCIVAPCPSMIINRGTVTGNIQKSFPERYEIIWDDGTTGFFASSEVSVLAPEQDNVPVIEPDPLDLPPVPVVVVPSVPVSVASGCGDDQYTVPFKIQGEEKCVDKTIALVLGAVAIYYILKK